MDKLLLEIVRKASGVFLWVEIVVKSLRAGFTNGDHLSDLKARVDIFPSELESLYEHMMKNINSVYWRHASHLFQIMRASRHGVSQDEIVPESIIAVERVFFATQEIHSALELQVRPPTAAEQKAQYLAVELRLKSHCAGLLEIVHQGISYDGLDDFDADGDFESDRLSFLNAYSMDKYTRLKEVDFHIEYIHRTAREFLENPEIWSKIVKDSNGRSTKFDPHLRLLSGAVMRLKIAPKLSSMSVIASCELGIIYLARVIMRYALLVKKSSISDMVRLVDDAEMTMDMHWQSWARNQYIAGSMGDFVTGHFSDHIGREYQDQKIIMGPQSSMFTLAIRSGLIEYVQAKIEEDDTVLKKSGRPLLDYIARPPNEQMGIEAFKADRAPLKIATLLFATGSAPNEAFDGRTPW